MNRWIPGALVVAALVAVPGASAQRVTAWADLGVGPSFSGAAWAVRVGGGIQRNHTLLVFRATNSADIVGIFVASDTTVVTRTEWSLLVGRGTVPALRHWYVAAGLGVAKIGRGSGDAMRLSVPVELAVAVRPLKVLGAGATLFANLNTESSFSGIVFSLQVGRLR